MKKEWKHCIGKGTQTQEADTPAPPSLGLFVIRHHTPLQGDDEQAGGLSGSNGSERPTVDRNLSHPFPFHTLTFFLLLWLYVPLPIALTSQGRHDLFCDTTKHPPKGPVDAIAASRLVGSFFLELIVCVGSTTIGGARSEGVIKELGPSLLSLPSLRKKCKMFP